MKIVITNAYSWNNKGDAGILLATIDTLKKIYNKPEFTVLSFTPDEDAIRYCKDKSIKNVYSNVLNPHPYKHNKIGKIFAIIKLIIQMIKTEIQLFSVKLIKKNNILNSLYEADIIVVCGGGFLGGKKFDSLLHLYQIHVNNKFNKPVYIIGTSIEPIHSRIIKGITEKVLKKVDYIFAREYVTYEYLKTFMPNNKICLIPDMAFMLEDKKFNFEFLDSLKKKNKRIIGITVRKWNFPNSSNKRLAMDNYVNELANTVDYFIENENIIFIYIPQVIVFHGNDSDIAKLLKDKISEKNREFFVIREDDWSPYEIKSLISNFDGFVGTRMHSNIFATSMRIPTVAIAYEQKTNGIMRTLDLDNYVVDIEKITSEELINKIKTMLSNDKLIRNHLNSKIINIRKEVIKKMEIVLKGRKDESNSFF